MHISRVKEIRPAYVDGDAWLVGIGLATEYRQDDWAGIALPLSANGQRCK